MNDGVDAIRVSFATAVKFIADMQTREVTAFHIERPIVSGQFSLSRSYGIT